MTMTRLAFLVPILMSTQVAAQSFGCAGQVPDWWLSLQDGVAEFKFPEATHLESMLETTAEGQDWPRAYTLVGDRDTAILLIEKEACGRLPYRAHVMTQRGQTPILLSGCCQGNE